MSMMWAPAGSAYLLLLLRLAVVQRSTSYCLKDVSSTDFCHGKSTSCCHYLSYRYQYNTVFRTCCDSGNVFPMNTRYYCTNDYATLYCSDSVSECCHSATSTRGKWHVGCCAADPGSSGWIIGGVIGTMVILPILAISSCMRAARARRKATNRMNAIVTVRQVGNPQQQHGAEGPHGAGSYPRPEGLSNTGTESNPSYIVGGQTGPAGPAGNPTVGRGVQAGYQPPPAAGQSSYPSAGPIVEASSQPQPSAGAGSPSFTPASQGVEADAHPQPTGRPSYTSAGPGLEGDYQPPSAGPVYPLPDDKPPEYVNMAFAQ
ncbi:uncharacterized protein LOC135496136 [Lineus longissimus]|uniref:uncharacterized protein LOC135496136 n=1 Tax=Lineus longissimus TaxID=88925 RepID=UPI00315CE00B